MEGTTTTSKVKKRRASRPKVRTGCTACKIRRVKCDETKPICYRCQECGSFCEYKLLGRRAAAAAHKVTTTTAAATAQGHERRRRRNLVPIQPRGPLQQRNPSDSFCDEAEGRYIRLFHEKLAFDLSGQFEVPFWTRLIPQQCHHEPAIKHAILALSALYRSAISSKTHTVNLDDEHVHFALVKQSQAISSLRESLSGGGGRQPPIRLALVSSLLFSCFESFHGNWETAIQQVWSGLDILRQLSQDERRRDATNGLADIDHEMGLTLRRLELQILSFLAMNPMFEHSSVDLNVEESILEMPDRFTTFNEAFTAATNLAVSALRHSRTSARCGDSDLRDLRTLQQRLQRSVSQWNHCFEPIFLDVCRRNPVGREYLGFLQLRICTWKCEIMIATSLSDTEVVFDRFTPQFERITHFSRHVLQKEQEILRESSSSSSDAGPRLLQYGMGSIMALFYTATRCRDFSIRKEAIAILREWPCTNGIWHSLQAAKVADWIAGLEEEQSCCAATAGGQHHQEDFIPEDCRVRMQSLKVSLHHQNRLITVECMQSAGVHGVLERRRANLNWP